MPRSESTGPTTPHRRFRNRPMSVGRVGLTSPLEISQRHPQLVCCGRSQQFKVLYRASRRVEMDANHLQQGRADCDIESPGNHGICDSSSRRSPVTP